MEPVHWRLFITAAVTFVVTIGFKLILPKDGKFVPGVLAGLVGRLLFLSYLGWVGTVAFHAIKLHRQVTKILNHWRISERKFGQFSS